MSKIVIKKTINLDFLGEEYKDSFLVFKSIPLKDYEAFIVQSKKQDESEAVKLIVNTLKKYFVEGKFNGADLTGEDIDDLDITTAVTVFKYLTGQELDPKSQSS
jgi:hypothetical protein